MWDVKYVAISMSHLFLMSIIVDFSSSQKNVGRFCDFLVVYFCGNRLVSDIHRESKSGLS